jgi:hypothetical protein
VHAYCLRRNHYHLVLETPNANLMAGMAWLQSNYLGTSRSAKVRLWEWMKPPAVVAASRTTK